MMSELALRVLAWFTWNHIQWIMVQCLNDSGLNMACHRVAIKLSTGVYYDKTWDTITLAQAMYVLK